VHSNDEQSDLGANFTETLAVRRAFLASVTTYSSSGGPRSNTSTTTEWTMENVGTWLDEAMAIAFRHDDLAVGARAFCLEWSHVGAFFPRRLHQCTIQLMDKKLQSNGFPSLGELVRVQRERDCP
jgi:hypothetical protein